MLAEGGDAWAFLSVLAAPGNQRVLRKLCCAPGDLLRRAWLGLAEAVAGVDGARFAHSCVLGPQ
jgi:hypothetical protein